MIRLRRTLAAGVLAVCSLVLAGPAGAAAGDNDAQAINTEDGSSLFAFAFDIRRVADGVVDQTNVAVAYASCEQCQTVAVAIQIVLVTGDADVVNPENVAVAVNESCTSCDTLASAYQFVIGGDGPVRFTAEGNRRLRDIRARLRDLERREGEEGLTTADIQAEIDAIIFEVRDVLTNDLVRGDGDDGDDDDEGEVSPSPTASASLSPSAIPSASQSETNRAGETPTPPSGPVTGSSPRPSASASSPRPTATPTRSTTPSPTAEATPSGSTSEESPEPSASESASPAPSATAAATEANTEASSPASPVPTSS